MEPDAIRRCYAFRGGFVIARLKNHFACEVFNKCLHIRQRQSDLFMRSEISVCKQLNTCFGSSKPCWGSSHESSLEKYFACLLSKSFYKS